MAEQKTEHLHLLAEPSLIEKIDEWGWQQRIRTRAEVIRLLVRKGLAEAEKEKGEASA